MGSIAISSPFKSLSDSLLANNQNLPGSGNAMTAYKYTGAAFDIPLTALGAPTAPAFPTVPADAVGMEVWSSSSAAADGIAFAASAGVLSNTGNLATNTSNNLGTTGSAPVRCVQNNGHMVLPFYTAGAVPAAWRFAFLTTAGQKLQGRYISKAAGFPYMMLSTVDTLLVGADAQQTLPTGTAAKFPTGFSAFFFQVFGGSIRFTMDGTVTTAALGDILAPGNYYFDQARHGVSAAALKIWMPTGTFLFGHAYADA